MTQGSGRWPKPAGDASAPPLAPGAGPGHSSVMGKRVASLALSGVGVCCLRMVDVVHT